MPDKDEDTIPMVALKCDNCGAIFKGEEGAIYCKTCDRQGSTDFQKVRTFIQENPGTDILTVSRATRVSAGLIMRYIKEGKIDARR